MANNGNIWPTTSSITISGGSFESNESEELFIAIREYIKISTVQKNRINISRYS